MVKMVKLPAAFNVMHRVKYKCVLAQNHFNLNSGAFDVHGFMIFMIFFLLGYFVSFYIHNSLSINE